jgi:hypothetical protein
MKPHNNKRNKLLGGLPNHPIVSTEPSIAKPPGSFGDDFRCEDLKTGVARQASEAGMPASTTMSKHTQPLKVLVIRGTASLFLIK